jgi:hypothetical protein
MNIELIRKIKTDTSTIGELIINDKVLCDTLEDVDRGLTQDMSEEAIKTIKIDGETAIPTGTYEVIIDMSSRFGRMMPHILDVPGFQGIRIHAGNSDKDTEGCLLLGTYTGQDDWITKSKVAVALFMSIIQTAIDNGEKIIIKIR